MARRCPNCGTENLLESRTCEKCGSSFEETLNREILAIKDVKVYSLLVLIMAFVSTAQYILNLLGNEPLTSSGFLSLFSGLNVANATGQITVLFFLAEIVIIATLVVQILGIIYLRAGFQKLVKGDYDFSTPATGSSLLIVGLILGMIGVVVVIALIIPFIGSLSQGSTPIFTGALGGVIAGGLLAALGGLLILIGYIIGVLLGLHRLASKFEEPLFDYGWVLLLISLFFTPLSIVAGYLFYRASTSTVEKLSKPPEASSFDTGWT